MRRYARYKDSGIEWIGEIPGHWREERLKWVVQINPSKNTTGLSATSEDLVTFLPMERVYEDGKFDSTYKKPIKELWNGFTFFEEGDIIIAKITPCFENGKGALLEDLGSSIGFGSTEFHVLRADSEIDRKFLFYITRTALFKNMGEALMSGAAGQKRVPSDFLENYLTAIPPLEEQTTIANYLDHKTAEIDQLIAKKQQLIELLQEEKTALINQAVTKGLNPDAPMKDSGIEWLGEVPGHWEVKLLKYVSPEITVGIVITPSKYYVPNGVPCLRSLNIKMMRIDENELVYISQESNQDLKKSMLFEGDLVAVRTGQTGTTAVVDKRFHETNCIDLIIIRKSIKYNSNFMAYQLNSSFAKAQFDKGSGGTIQQHFNIETAKNLIIVTPPVNEQEKISQYLDTKISEIDTIVKRENKSINLLLEYRTALISEAVTGKIDVRQWGSNRGGGTVAG